MVSNGNKQTGSYTTGPRTDKTMSITMQNMSNISTAEVSVKTQ